MKKNFSSISAITDLIFLESTRFPQLDLALVLGHHDPKAMDYLYPLYRDQKITKVLISGYASLPQYPPEAIRFAARAMELGFKKKDLILDVQATNTKENFQEFLKLINHNFNLEQINNILIVCLSFHTRRALMTAQSILPKHFNYYFLPIFDARNITKDNWWMSELGKKVTLSEVGKIGKYFLQGDLELI